LIAAAIGFVACCGIGRAATLRGGGSGGGGGRISGGCSRSLRGRDKHIVCRGGGITILGGVGALLLGIKAVTSIYKVDLVFANILVLPRNFVEVSSNPE
jgi:hypothetical protein